MQQTKRFITCRSKQVCRLCETSKKLSRHSSTLRSSRQPKLMPSYQKIVGLDRLAHSSIQWLLHKQPFSHSKS